MFKKVLEQIEQSNNILILTHLNPDGDALGSCVGFKGMVEKMGKKAEILLEKELPSMFSVFGDCFSYKETDFPYDLAVSLDCGDLKRLGECDKYFKGRTLNIDHHISNLSFGDVNYVDSSAAATGEIIFDLIKFSGIQVTPDIASALYGAILTDTGGFMFSNTTGKTHEIAGELINYGADFYNLNKKLIQEKDYQRQLISAKCIESMEFYEDGKICICAFDNEAALSLNMKDEDLNGIAQLVRSVTGVEAGALITEINKGTVKVSLRSDEAVNVSEVAAAFGGGGHIRASGVRFFNTTVDSVKEAIIKEIKKQLEGR